MVEQSVPKFKKSLHLFMALTFIMSIAAACGSPSGTTNGENQQTRPIKIGVSLSFTGDFSYDGKTCEQGYKLWADTVNAHGGLLGRKVALDIVADATNPEQVLTNYQKLITVDKVDLVFGPFSTLLTKPASLVANQYGYAMVEGSGGGPSVFNRNLHNIFDVSLSAANNLISFTQYILSLPAKKRPTTVAYATDDDPFTQPQIDLAKLILEQSGIKTVSYQVFPEATTNYTPIADAVISSGAQVAILGTLPVANNAIINRFKQLHYNPDMLIATAGPDQGSDFLNAIGGPASAEGVFVPNGWYPQANNLGNATMVKDYIARYGGTPNGVAADVAEAYSVGQVVAQAITKIKSFDNAKLIAELHSNDIFQSVQGPVKFDATGQNTAAQAYLFQWQKGAFIPVFPKSAATAAPEFPKPNFP
jgi:branched-chain amino acid transport system substrate-binding protein